MFIRQTRDIFLAVSVHLGQLFPGPGSLGSRFQRLGPREQVCAPLPPAMAGDHSSGRAQLGHLPKAGWDSDLNVLLRSRGFRKGRGWGWGRDGRGWTQGSSHPTTTVTQGGGR